MWSPESTTRYSGLNRSMKRMFWKMASAVPAYQLPTSPTWVDGDSMNAPPLVVLSSQGAPLPM